MAPELARVADVIKPILAFLDAEARRELGAELQVLGELGVEEGAEPRILGIGRCGCGRMLRGDCRILGKRKDRRSDEKPTQMTHSKPS